MPSATDTTQARSDVHPNPTLAVDQYSRDVLRSVADQLGVLANYHYKGGECSDADCAASEALDRLARQALALVGEVTFLRDGEPHLSGECPAGHGLPCTCPEARDAIPLGR